MVVTGVLSAKCECAGAYFITLFALLGYKLVEGKLDNGRMREVQRVNYAPS